MIFLKALPLLLNAISASHSVPIFINCVFFCIVIKFSEDLHKYLGMYIILLFAKYNSHLPILSILNLSVLTKRIGQDNSLILSV